MTTQQQKQISDLSRKQQDRPSRRMRWLIAGIALLLVAVGGSTWILTDQDTLTIFPLVLFTVLGVLIALLQWLFPFSTERASGEGLHTSPMPQAPLIAMPAPLDSLPPEMAMPPNLLSYRRIGGFPPLTDARAIQQREQTVKEVYALLLHTQTTAIALTGMGGAGKSTLAALIYQYVEEQRARQTSPFLSETLWLTVDPTVTFADLLGNIFEALEKPTPLLSNLAPHNQAAMLFNALDAITQPRLIVFDQFENLLNWETGQALADRPGVGEWLDLLNSRPCRCRFLLTSRPRPLGNHEDPPTCLREYPLGGLEIAEGVTLLRKRGVNGTEEALQSAVLRCEGHALSLSLLATLISDHALSLPLLLQDPSFWLGNIARNFLDHLYTKQLEQVQRALLVAFSVYREPVTLDAALALIPDVARSRAAEALKTLRVQHLVEPTGEGRYQLHALLAEDAHRRFAEDNERANQAALKSAHSQAAHYYQHLAATNCPPLAQRRSISDVHEIIEATWHYCQGEKWQEAYSLAEQEKLFPKLIRWGSSATLLELCLLLQRQKDWTPQPLQAANIHRSIAWIYNALGKEQEAREHNQKALRLYQEMNDLEGQKNVLDAEGWSYYRSSKTTEALECYTQALAICKERGDRRGEGHILNGLGRVYILQGRRIQALEYFKKALAISKESADLALEGRTLNNLGIAHTDLGNYTQALEYLEQSYTIRKNLGDRRGEGVALDNLGRAYSESGQYEKAIQYFQEALHIYLSIGDRGLEGWAVHNLGWTYNRLERYEQARTFLEQALLIHQEVGSRRGECRTTRDLGKSAYLLGQKQQALAYYHRALLIAEETHDPFGKATTLQHAARLYIDESSYEAGLACLLIARQIFDDIHSPYGRETQNWIDALQSKLGPDLFAALLAQVEVRAPKIVNHALLHPNND